MDLINHFTDVDECSTAIDECEQVCNNANGSYICLCDLGYALSGDRHSCNGTSTLFIINFNSNKIIIIKHNHSYSFWLSFN